MPSIGNWHRAWMMLLDLLLFPLIGYVFNTSLLSVSATCSSVIVAAF